MNRAVEWLSWLLCFLGFHVWEFTAYHRMICVECGAEAVLNQADEIVFIKRRKRK